MHMAAAGDPRRHRSWRCSAPSSISSLRPTPPAAADCSAQLLLLHRNRRQWPYCLLQLLLGYSAPPELEGAPPPAAAAAPPGSPVIYIRSKDQYHAYHAAYIHTYTR